MLPCCGSKIGSSCRAARQIRVKGRNSTYKGTRHGLIRYLLLAFYANERESPRAKTSRVNVQAMSHVSGLQLHAGNSMKFWNQTTDQWYCVWHGFWKQANTKPEQQFAWHEKPHQGSKTWDPDTNHANCSFRQWDADCFFRRHRFGPCVC